MTRAKHTISSRISFRSTSIEVNGFQVAAGGINYGRVDCSCGWSVLGNNIEAALEAFEKHKRAGWRKP